MNTPPTLPRGNTQAPPEARSTAPAKPSADVQPAWQRALDRAGERASQRTPEPGTGQAKDIKPEPKHTLNQHGPQRAPQHGPEDEASVGLDLTQPEHTLQQPLHNLLGPVAAALQAHAAGAQAVSTAEAHADSTATRAGLAASVAHLAAPADAGGVQHWQFSFTHAGAPVTGLALTAQAGTPWQMHLQLPAQARDRTALDMRLNDLRQRLAGRGADVGEVTLQTDPHDRVDRQEPR